MLANFASSAADGNGNNSNATTSVVGGADSVGNSLGVTTTNADQKEGEVCLFKYACNFLFVIVQTSANPLFYAGCSSLFTARVELL